MYFLLEFLDVLDNGHGVHRPSLWDSTSLTLLPYKRMQGAIDSGPYVVRCPMSTLRCSHVVCRMSCHLLFCLMSLSLMLRV